VNATRPDAVQDLLFETVAPVTSSERSMVNDAATGCSIVIDVRFLVATEFS
jgi:hypothetical protein